VSECVIEPHLISVVVIEPGLLLIHAQVSIVTKFPLFSLELGCLRWALCSQGLGGVSRMTVPSHVILKQFCSHYKIERSIIKFYLISIAGPFGRVV